MSTAVEIQNPYQSPRDTEVTPSSTANSAAMLPFAGSMTMEEGRQIDELLTGKKNGGAATYSQLASILASMAVLFGIFIYEAVVYDETDQLLELGLGAVGVAAVLVAGLLHKWHRTALYQKLKDEHQGAFALLAGQVTQDGIDFLVGDFPISYRWEDFVGAKTNNDAAVLYVDYPQEVNFMASSMFVNRAEWECFQQRIEKHVPPLGRFARLSVRKSSPRMIHIAAGTRALERHQWGEALAQFEQALLIRPDDAQALRGRMVAAVGTQNTERLCRPQQSGSSSVGARTPS